MILLYSKFKSSRLKYTLRLLFQDVLKTEYQICYDIEEFEKSSLPKINYSDARLEDAIQILSSNFLFEKSIQKKKIRVSKWKNLQVFFQTSDKADLPFDLFSVIFYLVTRYEEYVEIGELDPFGRFKAESSLAYKNNFLNQPLVNQLAVEFKNLLLIRFPEIKFGQTEYKYLPTFDVDMAFSYTGKGFWRNAGGTLKSLFNFQFRKIGERIKVLSGIKPDPFNNFDFIFKELEAVNYKPIIFMNLGKYGRYDKNISFSNLHFYRLLQDLNVKSQLNIHPSFASNSKIEILEDEAAKLEHVLGGDVIRSRQHFLILKWPETYRNLINLGILEDYSLGYASQLGFRASICTPFRFYDLLNEQETHLIIRPFAFMDGTMSDYMKLNSDEMTNKLLKLASSVKEVGGDLIGIWHNSSLAENAILKSLFVKSLSILK
jgi:hypothetical protein